MKGKKKYSLKDNHYYLIKILATSEVVYDNVVVRYEGIVDGLPLFSLASSEDSAPAGRIKSFKILKELDLIR